MLPSLDRPSTMVWTVAEGEEMVAFRLWSRSSTLVLLELGLEGTLADLRWQAMLGNGIGQKLRSLFLLEDGREAKLLQWCLPSSGFPLYIGT
jgi:hypothetical protein